MLEPDTPENVWRSQTEEKQPSMQIGLTPEKLCAMARSREKLNAYVSRALLAVTAVLSGAFLYNVYRIDQPWIRLGQAWTLGVIIYLFAPALESGRRRKGASDPCARFLERQHEERRFGYLRIRRRLFLFIPGIWACWWGGGPLAVTRAQAVSPSPWLLSFYSGPWLFLFTGAALILVWVAFGKAANKAARERDEVLRTIE
jgi:hypothetical protein